MITNKYLKTLTILRSLKLSQNNVITDNSVRELPKLNKLNIVCTANFTRKALKPLTNLTELTVSYNDSDYLKCLEFPQFKKLFYIRADEALDEEGPQQKMYVVERFFSLIDQDVEISKGLDYQDLQNQYNTRVILPNMDNMFILKYKTIYPFYQIDL
ncbi:MAG: hypothetical protein H0X26_10345 [Alphaproteobacteria bacterium]|nr:hypothetical protein [Alphaproteobacteria bacterium]